MLSLLLLCILLSDRIKRQLLLLQLEFIDPFVMDASWNIGTEQLFEIPLPRIMELAKEYSAHIYLIPEYYAPLIVRAEDEENGSRDQQLGYLCTPKAFILHPPDQSTMMPSLTSDKVSSQLLPRLDQKKAVTKSGSIKPSTQPKQKVAKVPRPRNAFIIYRGAKHDEVMRRGDISNTSASRIIAKMWKDEPPHVREYYRRLAMEESLNHKLQHPEYKYSPRRPGEKQRRSRRTKDINSTSNNWNMSGATGGSCTVRRAPSRSPSVSQSAGDLKSDIDTPSFSGDLFTVDCLPFYFSVEDQGCHDAMQVSDPLKNVTSSIGLISNTIIPWHDEPGSLYI
ncbi:hypothetical protein V1506DRAFT_529045 [Lipomyces tetrasporus]